MATVSSKRIYASAAWRQVRLVVLERDGWRCQIRMGVCTGKATAVDHVVPLSQGGDAFDPGNLRAACKQCNSGRIRRRKRRPSREW